MSAERHHEMENPATVALDDEFTEMLHETADAAMASINGADPECATTDRPRLRSRRKQSTAHALAKLALDKALTPTLRKALRRRPQLIVIFVVPSPQWLGPVRRAAEGPNHAHVLLRDASERRTEIADHQAINAAHDGRSVNVFTTDLGRVPDSLVAAADHIVTIPVPNTTLVRQVIARVCRGPVPADIGSDVIAGLDFDDLTLTIRPGRRAVDVVDALRRASVRRCTIPAEADAPKLETSRSFGPAREWGLSLARDVEAVRRNEISWSDVDRGAVVFGPPGTGKTLFARSLAAACKLPIIVSSVSEYFANSSGDLGAVVKAQREVFARASAMAPAILFLDEIDAVPNRATISDRGRDWWQTIVNDFLLLLDSSISRRSGIVVVGATNRIEDVDAAILRPGRLERAIHLGPPDADGLEDALRHQLGSDLQDADLSQLAARCEGATPAMAMDWVRQARRAARTARRPMVLADLEQAALPAALPDAASARRAAIHEAGHAVIGVVTGARVVSVTLGSIGATGGSTKVVYGDGHFRLREDLVGRILVLLAGRAAEEVLLGSASTGAGGPDASDLARATRQIEAMWARYAMGDELIFWDENTARRPLDDPTIRSHLARELKSHYRRTLDLVTDNRDAIERVAEALIARGFLTGDELSRLVDRKA